jgi:hypothetical protein
MPLLSGSAALKIHMPFFEGFFQVQVVVMPLWERIGKEGEERRQ